jgi:ferrochelatase
MKQPKTAILLLQIGSPESPTLWAVARYLGRFLSDRRLIDLANPWRWLLVYCLILPFRSWRSSRAYKKVWSAEGSPLVVHTQGLAQKLEAQLGDDFAVSAGMAYGSPSIASAVAELLEKNPQEILLLPLFPQGSSATTSALSSSAMEALIGYWDFPALRMIPPFFDRQEYLQAYHQQSAERLTEFAADHVLFSFHGMPHRHLLKTRPCSAHCLAAPACSRAQAREPSCYRGHAERSAALLAEVFGLPDSAWSLAYQSRLGASAWLGPSTDQRLRQLGAQGVRLAVISPSFTSDCLETLEELGIAGRETFLEAGGQDFLLLASLNTCSAWVTGLANICRQESRRF